MTSVIPENQLKTVRVPTPRDSIYKDECVLSFDTPESDGGLFISLVSFLGFSEDYFKQYYQKTNHAIFLHHKRNKKEILKTDEEGPEKKITRLAIGVEGGFAADSGPKYEYTDVYSIVTLPGPTTIALSDPSLPDIVRLSADSVIAADSSFKKAELDALNATWDGELRMVSKHADNLQQLKLEKPLATSGWKCEKCDLTANLWLNLTDGSILCGRRNFDGSGGNNHGVEHYAVTKYPLAVKLGTITQDGKADVYSYDEDDLVLDPNLAKHLAHFGINIGQLEKTDKSMAELEIDLNKKLGEWALCQESGSALVNVYGPSRTGLVNLGNSCYMNSVMQVMFAIPDFVRCFVDGYPAMVEECNYQDPAKDFRLQLGKLGFGLCSGKYSQPPPDGSNQEQTGISPRMFKQVVSAGNRDFSSASQQDAQEFFLHLINVLERNSRHKTNPSDVFKFKVEERLQCVESGQVMYAERTEYCLPLPMVLDEATNREEVEEYERLKKDNPKLELVRPIIPLQACLTALTKPELIEQFYSTALKRKTVAEKTTKLATFPNYLMVHMKKFAAKDGQAVKLDVAVEVPDVVDFEQLRGKGLQTGETPLPEEEAPPVVLNEEVLNGLVEFGCPLEAAKKATFYTNGAGLPEAYAWYEQHMNDLDLLTPFVPPGTKPAKQGGFVANEESVAMVMSMGFTQQQATRALQHTENDVERAIDWIFSHPDGGDAIEPDQAAAPNDGFTDGSPKYKLRGFITHMGTSATCGHYVCHIEQDGQWLIFNDNKVALSVHPPKELAYLYLYERC